MQNQNMDQRANRSARGQGTGLRGKMVKCLTCLLLIGIVCVTLVGCTLSTPWVWTSKVEMNGISSAQAWIWGGDEPQYYTLSDDEIAELTALLAGLSQEDFTHNEQKAGTTPVYGITVNVALESYRINQASGPSGSLETENMSANWWIQSEALDAFILSVCEKAGQ